MALAKSPRTGAYGGMKALLAACLLLLPITAIASDKAAVLADYKGYVEGCTADPGDRTVERCVEDQVSSLDGYLGDIVAEMTQYVDERAAKLMVDGQKAFEKYRNLTCNYEQAAHPEDKNAGLFCFLRLTTQRVDDVREGLDFATTGL
jgi:uncharacterized protein YecT (DUF1311 family)